jgi:hypothetical protein
MADGLSRVPLDLSVEWLPKTVTTEPPKYIAHTEWTLALRVMAATPVRAAVFLTRGPDTEWGLRPDEAATEIVLPASFFPHDWSSSDEVQVNFGWRMATVTDPALKSDPREVVKVTAPTTAETGEVFQVAELPPHAITLAAIAIVDRDIERRRLDRWRIKPELASKLPEQLAPLTSGHQSGVVRV